MSKGTFATVPHVASELQRMLVRQTELDPSSVEYSTLLRNIEVLTGTADLYIDIMDYLKDAGMFSGEPDKIVEVTLHPELAKAVSEKQESLSDEHPVESPFPDAKKEAPSKVVELPAVKDEAAQKSYKMTEVRAALVEARKKGVNVSALLKEFGVENFGQFPAGRYGELMAKLEE